MSDIGINEVQQNIKELQDQNAIDFQQWKRLGQEIEQLEGKIKTSDNHLNLLISKIKHDYNSLRKIIVDENVSVQLNDKIEENTKEINKKVSNENFVKKVSEINKELENKARKTYIYVEDYGATGDGLSDDTNAFQNAINYASANNKTICLLNKTYALSSITFKTNVSMLSNEYATLKILSSNNESFIKIDNGAITNLNYSACLKNIFIQCNENNLGQKIIDGTALKSTDDSSGGLWHFSFENIRIQTVTNEQIGIYLKADDTTQDIDVANQYLNFKNVTIYKNGEISYCLKLIGQIGQTKFDSCEMNGINNSVKGWLIQFEPLQSNDNGFMPITFDNCTFQSCEKGIYAKSAHVILNNCHVEGIANQFIQANGDLSHIEFNNSNISGGVKPFRIEGSGTIRGNGNTWIAPNGVACSLEGTPNGKYLFDLDLYMDNLYNCHEIPYYNHSGITLNVGYTKNVILTTKVENIQVINGMFKTGDTLTITNIADTDCNIENNNFADGSNLYWSGNNVITLKKYNSAKFMSNGVNFILIDVQQDVIGNNVIKTKDITLSFNSGVLTSEVSSGINFDKIISVFLLQSDDVYNYEPIVSVKTNGNIWAKAGVNPSSNFEIVVRVKYLE